MRAILQRVTSGSVTVDGEKIAEIGYGTVALVGITHDDNERTAAFLANKSSKLRIFENDEGKLNLSLLDFGGEFLAVPNFTLYADSRKGRRPSFTNAAEHRKAKELFLCFCEAVKSAGISHVECGEFGADMKVEIIGDGPVTIILDTDELMG